MKIYQIISLFIVLMISTSLIADNESVAKEQDEIARCKAAKAQLGDIPGVPSISCEEIVKKSKQRN